jgi:hypothetical protein
LCCHNVECPKEVKLIKNSEISVEYEIANDLSISWKLPQEYNFTNNKNIFLEFEMIMVDNTIFSMFLIPFDNYINFEGPEDMIAKLVFSYPKKPKCLHGIITKYNDEKTEKEQWFFYIDISNFNIILTEEEIEPGIFTNFARQWVPETITLEDGQWFKENAYYLITSYKYREKEINGEEFAIFKVTNDTEIIHNEDKNLRMHTGGLYLEEMHLRQISINGNSSDGFTLFVTPESKNIFKVKESTVYNY